MVGLNHEFARELLWREYPTDQRGSTFRQFWDVRSFFNADNLDDEALKEKLRDIPPLHTVVARLRELGDHDHREQGGENEDELVLVIRGELLKRYPNAVIYAHRACWQRKDGHARRRDAGTRASDPARSTTPVERRLAPLTAAEEDKPPRIEGADAALRGEGGSRHLFFGFDLTVDGGQGRHRREPDRRSRLVLRDQGAPGRAALRPRQRAAAARCRSGTTCRGRTCSPAPPGSFIEIATAPAALRRVADPGAEDDEKYPQYRGRQEHRLEPRHELRRAGLHPVPGAGAGRRARQRDAAEVSEAPMADFDDLREQLRRRARAARRRRGALAARRASS